MTVIRCLGVLFPAVLGLSWATAQAAIVTNGDFENTTGWTAGGGQPAGWTVSGPIAVQQTGTSAIGGSGTSVYVPGRDSTGVSNYTMGQTVSDTGPVWQFDLDFASEDPQNRRTLNVLLAAGGTDYINKTINLCVVAGTESGHASVQVYDESASPTWSIPTGLANSIQIDDDVTTTPLVHHLQIVGNYTLSTPSYTITLTNSAGNVFAETRSYFYGSDPAPGDGIQGIRFVVYNDSAKSYDYLIDNVLIGSASLASVPEPAALVLLGSALAVLIAWRRRKRFVIDDL